MTVTDSFLLFNGINIFLQYEQNNIFSAKDENLNSLKTKA